MTAQNLKNRNLRNEAVNGWKKNAKLAKGTEVTFRDSQNKLYSGVITKVYNDSYDVKVKDFTLNFDKKDGNSTWKNYNNKVSNKFHYSHSLKKA